MFSPSPAVRSFPRRGVRQSSDAPGGVPSLGRKPPPRSSAAPGSRTTSRTGTPMRTSVPRHRGASIASSIPMSVDGDENGFFAPSKTDITYAHSDELTATFYAPLPVELHQALNNTDFESEPYFSGLDVANGFAVVASVQTCFVWQYEQSLAVTPTCYIFACPPSNTTPPLYAIVPHAGLREPGFLLLSSTGTIRFWDIISAGLAGGEHFSSGQLPLDAGESVTALERVDPHCYIAATTSGRLFRILLTSYGGNHQVSSHVFSSFQASRTFSRFLPSLWPSAQVTTSSGNISALTVVGDAVWALIDSRIQRWTLSEEGTEELSFDEEVAELLWEAIKGQSWSANASLSLPDEVSATSVDLELVDLVFDSVGKIFILVSYVGQGDTYATQDTLHMQPYRIYTIVEVSSIDQSLNADKVVLVPYQSTSSFGSPIHPRLGLNADDTLVCAQFEDVVTISATASGYTDRLQLKSLNRTFGVGPVDTQSMLVLTSKAMIRIDVDMDCVESFNSVTGNASIIKSIMTQAILYGANPENPLQFTFPPDVDGEGLMNGAKQLSQAVLESDGELIRPNHDLGAQMNSRKERLSFLIKFINDNGALPKMSQESRQSLAADAETLFAGQQLWQLYNTFLAEGLTTNVLDDAVSSYMSSVNENHHDDLMRGFFRFRVDDLGVVLQKTIEVVQKSAFQMIRKTADLLSEANEIVLTVLDSARSYRSFNLGVYGVELPIIRPWTGEQVIIDIIFELFDSSAKMVESLPMGEYGGTNAPERTPRQQMPRLAATLFCSIRERLDWLESGAAESDVSTPRQRKELDDRFRSLRPQILEVLRRNGHAKAAFSLAEQYRDFQSLAALCNADTVFPPQNNPNAERIQRYIDTFSDNFTTELYNWYIAHGELRSMFAQGITQDKYLDIFFARNNNPTFSWIHDLGKRKFGSASDALLIEARDTSERATQQLMLSIGKLAQLAQVHEGEGSIDEETMDSFHDALDFISVHERLSQEFAETLQKLRGKQSLDAQVAWIVKTKAARLTGRHAFLNVFRQLVRQLLQGKALTIEEMADILSAKDNDEEHIEDFVASLMLLARTSDIPDGRRKNAINAAWRRIFLHDDWQNIRQTTNVTDAQLNEKFQHTALYHVLHSIHQIGPEEVKPPSILLPSQVLGIPGASELATRWRGLPPEEIEALENDYAEESKELAGLALEDVYERVKELATAAVRWDS